MSVKRFISGCIVFSTAALFLSDPILGPFFMFHGPEAERVELYISAVFYGLPLIAAFIAAWMRRPWPSASQWRVLDALAMAMAVTWAMGIVRGIVAVNETRFIVSDTFNFWVPIGVYVAMRGLDDTDLIDAWLPRIVIASTITQFLFTIWAIWIRGWQSGGLPFFVLFPVWFLHDGSLTGAAASLLLIAATRKRAIIAAAVFVVALFAVLARRRRLLAAAAGTVALFAILIAAIPSLRERFTTLPQQTGNFTHLEVRQDELLGMARDVRQRDWPLSLIIGQGMGATYRADIGESGARAKVQVIPRDHNSHISPAGWIFRIGIIGALAYGAFFLAGAYFCLRAAQDSRDAALTSAYITMLALSLATFSVPAFPIVPVTMMLVLVRRITSSRA